MIKKYLGNIYNQAASLNRSNIAKFLSEEKRGGRLLDVGCYDGKVTQEWIKATKATKVYGIEIISRAAKEARNRGVDVKVSDLNKRWPFRNNHFDYVVSNIVIEHISNVDNFISESYRVLKNGGVTIVSTNNLASWHNIFSLLFGWAPFDMSNSSTRKWSIGNPLSLHKDEKNIYGPTWAHKCVYTTRWLKEWYELYGFKFVDVAGAGYFPLPAVFGKFEKTHAALITLKFRK